MKIEIERGGEECEGSELASSRKKLEKLILIVV
jgi:hypothetical protein